MERPSASVQGWATDHSFLGVMVSTFASFRHLELPDRVRLRVDDMDAHAMPGSKSGSSEDLSGWSTLPVSSDIELS
jgi:hypothetical protein